MKQVELGSKGVCWLGSMYCLRPFGLPMLVVAMTCLTSGSGGRKSLCVWGTMSLGHGPVVADAEGTDSLDGVVMARGRAGGGALEGDGS